MRVRVRVRVWAAKLWTRMPGAAAVLISTLFFCVSVQEVQMGIDRDFAHSIPGAPDTADSDAFASIIGGAEGVAGLIASPMRWKGPSDHSCWFANAPDVGATRVAGG
ncbi:hypothetical protein MMRN_04930 [Mycobacterium marinum]|nr:hypothetical protein MMRN_04930 [Mycobacterium marinum]GJP14518.1 hypothetical protein NJB18001_50580 [Mycobacterium marinum]CDM74612.1 hypothetical membrane protein [Mycobacterium marinum E11]